MVLSALCIGAAAIIVAYIWLGRDPPLDGRELQDLRDYSEQNRKEQIHPFE
jgi:hypothetical protein